MWAHLNLYLDPEDPACSDPLRRVMAHLGDYAAVIVEPLKARPTDATLVRATNQRIEVRLTTATHHLLLVIAPEADLAHEVFFLRSLAACDLPAPRLIAYDLSCANVPFTYAIETYPGSLTLDRINDAALVRIAGRQTGRMLRRVHRIEARLWRANTDRSLVGANVARSAGRLA
jgi:aminoglycoside phosphotransferase (APT) family kinase protein